LKNILVVSAAVALLLLGWFLLFDLGDPRTDAPGGADVTVPSGDGLAGEEFRTDDSNRELIESSESVGETTRGGSRLEKPADPSLGSLQLKVVYGKRRKPAAFVRVLLLRGGMAWDPQQTYRTGSDGIVLIENLQPGSVYAKALRGGEKSFTVFSGQTKRGTLVIPSGVEVAVEVVDADGAPVEKANVWLSERWRDNRGAIAGVTGREGKVTLEDVSPHCNLAVRRRGFDPSHLHRISAAIGSTLAVRIILKRGGGMVEGIVVDERGEPVHRALVLIGLERPAYSHRKTDGTWSPGAPPISRVTGKDGRFSADVTPLGKLVLQVRHADHAPYRGEVEARLGALVSHRVVLVPGSVVFGKVSDGAGVSVPFARISVGEPNSFAGRMEFANESGEYEIRGLAAGEQKARAVKKGSEVEQVIRLAVAERVEWNPVLAGAIGGVGTKLLVGRVLDHLDQPLRRWRVVARSSAQSGDTVGTNTDSEGRFQLAVKSDELRVWTHAPGKYRDFPAVIRDGVRVDQGELILRVDAAALRVGEIKGVVIDSAGQPVRANVQTWHHELSIWREFKTDAKTGEFRIENVPPGKIDLKVTSGEHPWRVLPAQTIGVGQTIDLDRIVMQSGGRIEGTLRFIGGRTPRQARVGIYYEKGGEAGVAKYIDGRFRSGVLAPGRYNFQILGDRFAAVEAKVTVTADSTTTKSFRVQPAALRSLKFIMPEGAIRPRFMSVNVRAKDGKLAGYFGFGATSEMTGNVSVLPGEYTVRVWGPKATSWLVAKLTVASLADADPITYTLELKR
jgi:hypothetical protein